MAFTNAWSEGVPLGSENASTADDYLRQWRLDHGERLEDMFYGYNAASNAAPENDYGVKSLRLYKQSSDPTQVTDYAHLYVKLVSGVPEVFFQDDTNTAVQLTSGGNLKSTANLVVDGTSTLTGNVTASGTLDVTGATELIGVATIADTSVTKTTAAPAADAQISNKKYVDEATLNPGTAKGWVIFDGSDADPDSTKTHHNVTSITDNGTGDYTITWDTNFSSAAYCVIATCRTAAAGNTSIASIKSGIAAGSVGIKCENDAGTAVDPAVVCVVAFGSQ